MSDTVVRVENLSKKYILGHQRQERYTTLRDSIANSTKGLLKPFQRGKSQGADPTSEDFWALKDVSFEIKQGDKVGIIGRNGAGKSTLLKILSRITEPTNGSIGIKGRVASLLEVGTGFHPELTGRENIFLNGAILGMGKIEIQRKFDEIVAFAEVEKFLDTPVKRYSSGMYVRLAFAVAAHLEPEILIVDEVLAVGDAQFQKKCLGKMEDVGKEGRTVLFVSHNMSAIQSLCSRCIFLYKGQVKYDGEINKATQLYLGDSSNAKKFDRLVDPTKTLTIKSGEITTMTDNGSEYVKIDLQIHCDKVQRLSLDLRLSDANGSSIGFGSLGSLHPSKKIEVNAGMNNFSMLFSIENLANGTYFVSLDLNEPKVKYYDRVENCLSFEVSHEPKESYGYALEQSWGYGSFEIDIVLQDKILD